MVRPLAEPGRGSPRLPVRRRDRGRSAVRARRRHARCQPPARDRRHRDPADRAQLQRDRRAARRSNAAARPGSATPIAPRPFAPRADTWWRRMMTRLTDPTRWRQVAFVHGVPRRDAGAVHASARCRSSFSPSRCRVSTSPSAPASADLEPLRCRGDHRRHRDGRLVGRAAVLIGGAAHPMSSGSSAPTDGGELEARVDTLSEQRQRDPRRRVGRAAADRAQPARRRAAAARGARHRHRPRAGAARRRPRRRAGTLDEARDKVRGSIGELRMIGRGLHPAVLDDRGLDAALSAIVASSPIPIDVVIEDDRTSRPTSPRPRTTSPTRRSPTC